MGTGFAILALSTSILFILLIVTCVSFMIPSRDGWDSLDFEISRKLYATHPLISRDENKERYVVGSMIFGKKISMVLSRNGSYSDVEEMRLKFIDDVHRRQFSPRTCSESCECTSGGMVPYGRYCGFGYTGCPGVPACDDADECCRIHDACVTEFGYTDCNCTIAFTKCQECVIERAARKVSTKIGGSNWVCRTKMAASVRMAADVKFILPTCYDRAKSESKMARGKRKKNFF